MVQFNLFWKICVTLQYSLHFVHGFSILSSDLKPSYQIPMHIPIVKALNEYPFRSMPTTTSIINLVPVATPNTKNFTRKRILKMTDKIISIEEKNQTRIRNGFIKIFFSFCKGLTLPFPTLRNLIIRSKEISTKEGTEQLSGSFSIRECLFAMLCYLGIGGLAYTKILERWSFVDAIYFTVVSFSTVGYGDVCPTNRLSKIFTCIFSLGGVAFLGIALASIGSSLVQVEMEVVRKAENISKNHITDVLLGGMNQILPSFRDALDEDQKSQIRSQHRREVEQKIISSIQEEEEEEEQQQPNLRRKRNKWFQWIKKVVFTFLPSLMVLFSGGILMGRMEGWSILDSLYYSIITAGTLGFGDFSPVTRSGRFLAIVFIPIAVGTAGEFLGNIGSILVERRKNRRNAQLLSRNLDRNYILELDANKDGEVSKLEFVEFLLKEMDLVDQELLDNLHNQFDQLDVAKNGVLGEEDLRIMAELGQNI